MLSGQSRPVDAPDRGGQRPGPVGARLVDERSRCPTTYLGSAHNLGGAGGFALGMLHALALGADWVWLADDDGRPEGPEVLATLFACAATPRPGRGVAGGLRHRRTRPPRLPAARRGCGAGRRSELTTAGDGESDLLPGIASLFNGALFRAATLDVVGVPDLRLFVRGDEVELHRRIVRSGLPFGTCLQTAGIRASQRRERVQADPGWPHARPVPRRSRQAPLHLPQPGLSGRGSQPGMRTLLPQEWLRFTWFFLITRRGPGRVCAPGSICASWAARERFVERP